MHKGGKRDWCLLHDPFWNNTIKLARKRGKTDYASMCLTYIILFGILTRQRLLHPNQLEGWFIFFHDFFVYVISVTSTDYRTMPLMNASCFDKLRLHWAGLRMWFCAFIVIEKGGIVTKNETIQRHKSETEWGPERLRRLNAQGS